jgi:hypothetical protein
MSDRSLLKKIQTQDYNKKPGNRTRLTAENLEDPMGYNLPDGCTQDDIDRSLDGEREPSNMKPGPPVDLPKALSKPLLEQAESEVARLQSLGWTKDDFARALSEELDPEDECELAPEPVARCHSRATRIVEEPWTPGRFKVRCCQPCAESLIRQGYHDRGAIQ